MPEFIEIRPTGNADDRTWIRDVPATAAPQDIAALTNGQPYQMRAVNVSAWSPSVTPVAAGGSGGGGGGFTPNRVSLTNARLDAIGALPANTRQITFATCLEFAALSGSQQYLQAGSGALWNNDGNLALYDDAVSLLNGVAPIPADADGRTSIVFQMDRAQGLPGGASIRVTVNGTVFIESTTALPGDIANTLQFFATEDGANPFRGNVRGWFWLGVGNVDPSLFFDAQNQPRDLGASGVLGGVTPRIYINGDATDWLSGTDALGNSYAIRAPDAGGTAVITDVT